MRITRPAGSQRPVGPLVGIGIIAAVAVGITFLGFVLAFVVALVF